ncbi:recombinase family protein [Rufibacter sp. LB8]|uniref:recombinase family protein n=1 Tax=Rufibacter sp. LB8 TaxID=2777781 RepID=UPI00178C48FA|nr:recombinase family protein [Rufibacter sp. LB8]
MKAADLYIRVSTDEQADKGYSQRSQEEILRKYCEFNQITIRKVIYEDHSAKTFQRPEWMKLLTYLKKHKHQSELILFTKWDRFSRNAPDAYQMINTLRSLGVEPQAIEQPLDTSIPENKMMLAIYLTAPEIENDRRALNVFHGMRRARKEGRWMTGAPIGYANKTGDNGRKQIVPQEPQASIMKGVFKDIAEGIFTVEQVWKKALRLGLKCSKTNFWLLIRNPVYCGKVVVPKYRDEEEQLVQGQHEPLISETLFYEAQQMLNGKKRVLATKVVSMEMLPLRGFLTCSNCTRTLTGSASRGRYKHYYYYHCSTECGCRHKAPEVNQAFVNELKRYILNPAVEELFKMVILDTYHNRSQYQQESRKQHTVELAHLTNKLARARDLLLAGDLDGAEYRNIKADCEQKINLLEAQLAELATPAYKPSRANLETLVEKAVKNLTRLDEIFENAGTEDKRELIGSMFTQKFTFEDLLHRTTCPSDPFKLTYLINSELNSNKKGQISNKANLSYKVAGTGLEPVTFGL